jgi:hypothetical protein
MSLQNGIQPILQKEMSRKEFLITLGLGIATVLGFSHIIHLFTGKTLENRFHSETSNATSASSGYGIH